MNSHWNTEIKHLNLFQHVCLPQNDPTHHASSQNFHHRTTIKGIKCQAKIIRRSLKVLDIIILSSMSATDDQRRQMTRVKPIYVTESSGPSSSIPVCLPQNDQRRQATVSIQQSFHDVTGQMSRAMLMVRDKHKGRKVEQALQVNSTQSCKTTFLTSAAFRSFSCAC